MDQNWPAIVAYGKAVLGELELYSDATRYREWLDRVGDPFRSGGIRDLWRAAYGDDDHFEDAQRNPNYDAFGIVASGAPIVAPREPDEIKRLIRQNYNLNVLCASRTWPNGGGGYIYPTELNALYPDAMTHGHKWGYRGSGTPQRSWRGGPAAIVENWDLVGSVIIPTAAIAVMTFGIGSLAGAAPSIGTSIKIGATVAGAVGAVSAYQSSTSSPPEALKPAPAAPQLGSSGLFGMSTETLLIAGAVVFGIVLARR